VLAAARGAAYLAMNGARVDQRREPILNVPAVVVLVLVALGVIHAVRVLALSDDFDRAVVFTLGFVPARYSSGGVADILPGGFGADIWTFFTYGLLHADLTHLGFNAIWLLAFASPVSRRFGTVRFLLFFFVTVAAGAVAHLITHSGDLSPMIGASAAISGMMGAATRFAFQPGGSLDFWRGQGHDPDQIPAAPLMVALRNPRVLAFVGVWFGLNLLFGIGSFAFVGAEQSIAWEAHVGGFLAGLLFFSAFDPVAPWQPGEPLPGEPEQEQQPTLH
jgi:membrane associated rhomboid family serine protease